MVQAPVDERAQFGSQPVAQEAAEVERVEETAAHVGVAQEAGFDPERFIITNAYTGGSDNLKKTYSQAPKHRHDEYNAMCRGQLDYERGDDFLQIGQMNLRTGRRYLLRAVPRSSLWSILSRGLFLLGGSVIVPAVQWFSPGTQLGELRPWNH